MLDSLHERRADDRAPVDAAAVNGRSRLRAADDARAIVDVAADHRAR